MDRLPVPESAREGWRLWQVAHNDVGSSAKGEAYPSPKDDRVTVHANAVAQIGAQIKLALHESIFSKVKQLVLPSWISSFSGQNNASSHSGNAQIWTHLHLQHPDNEIPTGNSDGGHQADLDIVVASPAGLLVIEVKTWQGTVHASSADANKRKKVGDKNSGNNANEWVEVGQTRDPWMLLQRDGTHLPRKNPVAQAMAKARALREYLVDTNIIPKSCLVQGLVLFANEACTLSPDVAKMDHVVGPDSLLTVMNVLKLHGLGPIVVNPRVLQYPSSVVVCPQYSGETNKIPFTQQMWAIFSPLGVGACEEKKLSDVCVENCLEKSQWNGLRDALNLMPAWDVLRMHCGIIVLGSFVRFEAPMLDSSAEKLSKSTLESDDGSRRRPVPPPPPSSVLQETSGLNEQHSISTTNNRKSGIENENTRVLERLMALTQRNRASSLDFTNPYGVTGAVSSIASVLTGGTPIAHVCINRREINETTSNITAQANTDADIATTDAHLETRVLFWPAHCAVSVVVLVAGVEKLTLARIEVKRRTVLLQNNAANDAGAGGAAASLKGHAASMGRAALSALWTRTVGA